MKPKAANRSKLFVFVAVVVSAGGFQLASVGSAQAESSVSTSGRCTISVVRQPITGGETITPIVRVFNTGQHWSTYRVSLRETLYENTIAKGFQIQKTLTLGPGRSMAFRGRGIPGNTGSKLVNRAVGTAFTCGKTVIY